MGSFILITSLVGGFAWALTAPFSLDEKHSEPTEESSPSATQLTDEVVASLPSTTRLTVERKNFIDDYIFARIEAECIPHAGLSTHTEFIRRVYLDLWGRIPDDERVREFVADNDPNKRDRLIDHLLGHDYPDVECQGNIHCESSKGPWMVQEPFLSRWSYWFGDLFDNGPIQGVEGRNAFHQYIYYNLKYNIPYDYMVRDMLTATTVSAQFGGAANFLIRSEVDGLFDGHVMHEDSCDEMAVNATKLFLGLNLECISCHDGAGHLEKINLWLARKKRVEFWRQAAFFGNIRIFRPTYNSQEFALLEGLPLRPESHWQGGGNGYSMDSPSVLRIARNKKADVYPQFVLTQERPASGANLRVELARMLTSDLQFAKATVNLFWSHFMTVGIVDPPFAWDLDRQDPQNPPPAPWTIQPSHPELLEELAKDFQKHGFDLRYLMKVITQSSAYQLSSRVESDWKPDYDRYFARKLARRLSAEEIYDAISKATNVFPEVSVAGTDKKVSYIMETYDPSFDKLEPGTKRFLDFFGRSDRKSGAAETTPSVVQASLMLNSEVVKNKVLASTEGSRINTLLSQTPPLSNEQLVENIYLSTLSRFPTREETEKSVGYLERYRDKGAEDIQWALINKLEFIVNY